MLSRFFNRRRSRMQARKTEIKPLLRKKQLVLKLGAPLSFSPCMQSTILSH